MFVTVANRGNLAVNSFHAISEVDPENSHSYQWFAARVRSNFERVTAAHLRERGFQEFTPTYLVERHWSDRKKLIDQVLFPGYVFCRIDFQDRGKVLTVPGLVGLVGAGKTPLPIPDSEIEAIRKLVRSGNLVTPWPFLEIGQRVLIERGPLAGIEGILDGSKGRSRLVVSINMLQRSISAEVDRSWIRAVSPRKAAVSAGKVVDGTWYNSPLAL
jgi:transcription antitermination factor NusG